MTLREPKALLFDLDGTLVDSRADIADALNRTLVARGRERLPLEAVMAFVGDGARALVSRAFGSDDIDEELALFGAHYKERPCARTTLLPGARESLALGIPCAVVTNKPTDVTRLVLAQLGVEVAAVWGGSDGPLKPDPSGVRWACARIGVAPAEAWMVGDGPQDILAGRAAGAFTVGVPGIAKGTHLAESKPDLLLASLAELPATVRRAGPRSP